MWKGFPVIRSVRSNTLSCILCNRGISIEQSNERDGKRKSVEKRHIIWSTVGTRKTDAECEAIFDNIPAIWLSVADLKLGRPSSLFSGLQ